MCHGNVKLGPIAFDRPCGGLLVSAHSQICSASSGPRPSYVILPVNLLGDADFRAAAVRLATVFLTERGGRSTERLRLRASIRLITLWRDGAEAVLFIGI